MPALGGGDGCGRHKAGVGDFRPASGWYSRGGQDKRLDGRDLRATARK
jgi:hypothetical protein